MRKKTCFRCRKAKRLDQFYEHPMMADGRLGKCAECTRADARARYREQKARLARCEQEHSEAAHKAKVRP